MKYLMLEIPMGDLTQTSPIMFPNFLTHSIVLEAILAHPLMQGAKAVSAGEFSSMDLADVHMHGRSVSLDNLASRPEDSKLLPMLDYTAGIL